jgi:TPP-dependent 2-oxoacid decarboxylase
MFGQEAGNHSAAAVVCTLFVADLVAVDALAGAFGELVGNPYA